MTNSLILLNTAFAILAAVLLITRFRVNPVIALLLSSSYLGMTCGLGVDGTIEAITRGFGDLMAEIGLLVAFPTTVLSVAIMQFVFRHGWWDESKDELPAPAAVTGSDPESAPDPRGSGGAQPAKAVASSAVASETDVTTTSQPPLVLLFAPVLGLIATGAILDILELEIAPLAFVCDPVIALLVGLIGTILVTRRRGRQRWTRRCATGSGRAGRSSSSTGSAARWR